MKMLLNLASALGLAGTALAAISYKDGTDGKSHLYSTLTRS